MDIATRVRMNPRRVWLTVAVRTGVPWPAAETCVVYEGTEFFLRPGTEDLEPSVAIAYDPPATPQSDTIALQRIRGFLSALAWIERARIREIATYGTGGYPGRIGRGPVEGSLVASDFRIDYLPVAEGERAKLCLGIYREALNLNSEPYQFLGFFKILNVVYRKGLDQAKWINSTLAAIKDYPAITRVREIRRSHADVGKYLYKSGRCAVAHAFGDPIVNPDDPEDTRRLRADLPVIQALAEILIGQEFDIQTKRTYHDQHLYELEGFRTLLGGELLTKLKTEEVTNEAIPTLPRLSFRVRKYQPYPALEGMTPRVVAVRKGCVWLRCRSNDDLANLIVGLDFRGEGIAFDLKTGLACRDDGSTAATRRAIDCNRFFRDLVQLGELEIWDGDSGALLGRADPLIPANISMQGTLANVDGVRTTLEEILKKRMSDEAAT